MSANPPKNDAWPPWADIRFVLVRSPGKLRPCRGLILDWRGKRREEEALVVYYDDAALLPVTKDGVAGETPPDPRLDRPELGAVTTRPPSVLRSWRTADTAAVVHLR